MLLMLAIHKIQRSINSFWLTFLAVIPVVLISFFTPFFAISVSANGFAQNGIKSATGAAVLLPVGVAFSLATIIWGTVICTRNFRSKSLKKNFIKS